MLFISLCILILTYAEKTFAIPFGVATIFGFAKSVGHFCSVEALAIGKDMKEQAKKSDRTVLRVCLRIIAPMTSFRFIPRNVASDSTILVTLGSYPRVIARFVITTVYILVVRIVSIVPYIPTIRRIVIDIYLHTGRPKLHHESPP